MSENQNSVQTVEKVDVIGSLTSPEVFDHMQRVAKMYASSSLIPKEYQNNVQNTVIALEMANRIGANPLMVMQNLYIVHGKPSWSSTFIISAINSCGKFSPLRFEESGEGDEYGVRAWAYDKETKDRLDGVKVTKAMVRGEGWADKNGSKWKTMPELMFRYRAATFFGRLYAPEILMGMHSVDEIEDIQYVDLTPQPEQPKKKTPFTEEMIQDCAFSIEMGATIEQIKEQYDISPELEAKLKEAVKK